MIMKITVRANQNGQGLEIAGNSGGRETDRNMNRRNGSISASGWTGNNGTADQIAQKRKNARTQAKHLIDSAWNKDRKIAQGIQNSQEIMKQKEAQNATRSEQLKDLSRQKKDLQEAYGIEDGSQEQQDLHLLEKYQNYKQGRYTDFSEEEISRLKELQNTEMTEYQKKVLELNGVANQIQSEMAQNSATIQRMEDSIRDDQKSQLGSQTMRDAQDAADAVLEATEQDVMGMLIQDSRDHIDKTMEEEQKKAEEAAKKKEEQEEKLEKAKEKREETEKILQGDAEADELELDRKLQNESGKQTKAVQKQIRKIIKDNHLVEDDLKGIEIDFDF